MGYKLGKIPITMVHYDFGYLPLNLEKIAYLDVMVPSPSIENRRVGIPRVKRELRLEH